MAANKRETNAAITKNDTLNVQRTSGVRRRRSFRNRGVGAGNPDGSKLRARTTGRWGEKHLSNPKKRGNLTLGAQTGTKEKKWQLVISEVKLRAVKLSLFCSSKGNIEKRQGQDGERGGSHTNCPSNTSTKKKPSMQPADRGDQRDSLSIPILGAC